MTISKVMLEQIQKVHNRSKNKWPGNSLLPHIDRINSFMKVNNLHTMLDYGCGKASYHPDYWNIEKYDPGVAEFSIKPKKVYDMVICTDVLEHVEEIYIDEVLTELFEYSTNFLYLAIALDPAIEILPDGRNAHVLLKPEEWWKNKLRSYKIKYPKVSCHVSWSRKR